MKLYNGMLLILQCFLSTLTCGIIPEQTPTADHSTDQDDNQINFLEKTFQTNANVGNLFEGDIVHDAYVDFVYQKTIEKLKSGDQNDDVISPHDDVRWAGNQDDARFGDQDTRLQNDVLDNRADSVDWTTLYSDCPIGQTKRYQKRAAIMGYDRLWPNGIVYYEFDHSISPKKQKIIKSSMTHLESNTCVRFQPRTQEPDYLEFYNGAGCFTVVGRSGGRQGVSINDGCMFMGTVAHELAHALGFWHEQSRPDRDFSVNIVWENIKPGKEHNFNKMDYSGIDSRGIIYDYNSIMHYGPHSFSINDSLPTIVAKNKTSGVPITMGQRSRLSVLDIEQANRMYCCPVGACSNNPCRRGRCSETLSAPYYTCSCFTGWYGDNCSENDNRCALLPCSNGQCVTNNHSFGGFQCVCNEGYQGLLCDEEINECDPNPCKNGGVCEDKLGYFECICENNNRGDRCEYQQCPEDMFGCTKQGVCVTRTSVCDFNNDCGDWSDETVECGTCTFEEGMCGWQNTSNWKWVINGGSTPSEHTGPDLDHTLRSVAGKYLYVEASDQFNEGQLAEITSPEYIASSPTCKMEFAYYMFGSEMGSLLVEAISRYRIEKLFQASGNQGKYWHLARVDLGKRFQFKIRFVAVRGDGWRGDIAVDDILFTNCATFESVDNCEGHVCVHGQCLDDIGKYTCQCNPGYQGDFCDQDVDDCAQHNCTVHGQCVDKVNGFACRCEYGYMGDYCQIEAEYICDIEDGLCGPWVNSAEGDFLWEVGQGQTPSKGTGPSLDHTFGERLGHYLYVEGSEPQSPGHVAIIEMGPLVRSAEDCIVSFFYHMNGATMGNISVSVKHANNTVEVLWVQEGDQGDQWLAALVPIGQRRMHTIQIKAVIGTYWESDAALDDIMLAGQCGVIDPCVGVQCGEHGRCFPFLYSGEHVCYCSPGYEGELCEFETDECRDGPCGEHGTCQDLINGYNCTCLPGYEGRDCELTVQDECEILHPCQYGNCVDLVGGFRCECEVGYIGRHCEVRSCSPNPCSNDGICMQKFNSFYCQCGKEYEGDLCEKVVVNEVVDPVKDKEPEGSNEIPDRGCEACVHGSCVWNNTRYTCVCDQGYVSEDCNSTAHTDTGCNVGGCLENEVDDEIQTVVSSSLHPHTTLAASSAVLIVLVICDGVADLNF